MMDNNIKRTIILDNYENPYNKGLTNDKSYVKVNANNSSCIDNLDLEIVIGEDETLKNVYSVVRIKDIDDETKAITDKLVEFYSSDEMKDTIREYGKDKYGEPLYFVIGE